MFPINEYDRVTTVELVVCTICAVTILVHTIISSVIIK